MKYKNAIISILILLGAGYIYNKLKLNIETSEKMDDLDIIKRYFLNEHDDSYIDKLGTIKKPIIWIHIDYKMNSRNWRSFMERNSIQLNQPYIYLTIRSIISQCSKDFHICLIDDNSFKKLLNNWKIDFSVLSTPHKQQIRNLAILKLIYKYGGVYIENSFIMFKTIKPIYDDASISGKPIFGEFMSNACTSNILNMVPSTQLIVSSKNNSEINKIIKELEIIISQDATNESIILETLNRVLLNALTNNKITCIDGRFIGTRDKNNKIIMLEDLMSNTNLELDNNSYSLYIPRDCLEKRTFYNWFIYLSTNEILGSNINISKFLLISNDIK